ncbi:MAG TPA: hypothetical protein VFL81_01000, partial [Candidatus Saccharimonadales bacterium]|nr:hypothetical protein [Candidatus Saccharimonadales bacterium]
KTEIDRLAKQGLRVNYVFSGAPARSGRLTGYINLELIKRLAPDYLERDIYLCGPTVMMDGLISQLLRVGLPAEQLHFERFRLP